MGVVRSSDLAVSSAAAIVTWLLVRTALRGSVALSVACVTTVYFVALWARVKRATRAVRLPLMAFFSGLCVVRAFEFAWDLPGERVLIIALSCAVMGAGARLAASRARLRVGVAVGASGWAIGCVMGELRAATSMLFVLWLARAFARVWTQSERLAWARRGRWIAAAVAVVWAWRGATIGPAALMIGASAEAGGVVERDELQGEWLDSVVFVAAALGLVLTRAWESCPLVFV
jgi:hypothetical protein